MVFNVAPIMPSHIEKNLVGRKDATSGQDDFLNATEPYTPISRWFYHKLISFSLDICKALQPYIMLCRNPPLLGHKKNLQLCGKCKF